MEDGPHETTLSWQAFGTVTRGRLERVRGPAGAPGEILLLDRLTGDGGWEAAPLPVEAGAEYGLTWSLKCTGPGGYTLPPPRDTLEREEHAYWDTFFRNTGDAEAQPFLWHHFIDFLGVELEWLDAAGRPGKRRPYPMAAEPYEGLVGSHRFREFVRNRDNLAADWSPVWLRAVAPAGAAAVRVRFRLASRAELGAGVALGDPRWQPARRAGPPAAGCCRYVIRTLDPQTGRPLPARISMRDQDGRWFAPAHAFTVRASFAPDLQFFYALSGEATVDAPLGHYAIEAVAGCEREVARAQADYVREGRTEIIELELARRLDLRGRGWHGGDHHLHLSGHATKDFPVMDPLTALELGRADGLDYLPFQADYFDYRRGGGQPFAIDGAIGQLATEICSFLWGHYCTLAPGAPVPLPPSHRAVYPSMYDVVRSINARGGFCMAAHPHQMICQPFNTVVTRADLAAAIAEPGRLNCARELPLILLLGEPCGYDLLIADGAGVQPMATREYHRLLDFGFRVTAGGSTDTGVNSARGLYPSCRTYVRADRLDFGALAEGYRRGRTFATNGPVLLADADGRGPGETAPAREGQTLAVKVEAFSPWGLAFVEVLFNGRPVARRELSGHDHAEVELPVTVRAPGWLAVVVRGPGARWVNSSAWPEPGERERLGQFAHTTPVYVRFADRPLRPSAESAAYYRRWLDSLRALLVWYRPQISEDERRAGLAENAAWDILNGRLDQARARLDALARDGWPD